MADATPLVALACTDCGGWFSRLRTGRTSRCAPCRLQAQRRSRSAWNKAHPDVLKAAEARYRATHPWQPQPSRMLTGDAWLAAHPTETRYRGASGRLRHGHARHEARTRTYRTWQSMVSRTTNPRHTRWAYYGGRGITLCERWRSFDAFLADMGERPAGKSLDRIDNDGNYEPGNCRWATQSEQVLNSRRSVR